MPHSGSVIPVLFQITELIFGMKDGLNNPETERDLVHVFGVPKRKAKESFYVFFGSILI
jgi:hypothetical protein